MGSSLAQLLSQLQMGQNPNSLQAMVAAQMGQPRPPMPQAPIPQAMSPQLPPAMPRPAMPSRVGGVLSKFNDTVMNTLAPNPGAQVEGLIGRDAIKSAQSNALLSLGASLLQSGGFSTRPVTLGEALGRGIEASQKTYGNSLNTATDNAVAAENAKSYAEQRAAQADANKELARQRETERIQRDTITRGRTAYKKYEQGWDGLTTEQTVARYRTWFAEAEKMGDTETANRVSTMITNVLQNAPKPKDMQYESGGNGQLYRIERQPDGTVKEVPIGQPRPISSGGGGGGGSDDVNSIQGMQGVLGRLDKKATEIAVSTQSMAAQVGRLAQFPNSGVEQVAVLYDFIKARDGSTVRDSERELLARANSLLERFNLSVARLQSGEVLSQPQIKDMQRVLASEIESKRKAYASTTIVDMALLKGRGVDVSSYDRILNPPRIPNAPDGSAAAAAPPPRKSFTTFTP